MAVKIRGATAVDHAVNQSGLIYGQAEPSGLGGAVLSLRMG